MLGTHAYRVPSYVNTIGIVFPTEIPRFTHEAA